MMLSPCTYNNNRNECRLVYNNNQNECRNNLNSVQVINKPCVCSSTMRLYSPYGLLGDRAKQLQSMSRAFRGLVVQKVTTLWYTSTAHPTAQPQSWSTTGDPAGQLFDNSVYRYFFPGDTTITHSDYSVNHVARLLLFWTSAAVLCFLELAGMDLRDHQN